MKRFTMLAICVLALVGLMGTAWGQNAHFIKATASINSDCTLSASFKEAGVGDNLLITESLSADSTATYACINGGGNHPKASNKETVGGPVSASGEFPSGKNGNIVGSLTVSPVGPGSFSCPSGQRLVLASCSYTNVSLTDITNGDSANIPGTFSLVLVNIQ